MASENYRTGRPVNSNRNRCQRAGRPVERNRQVRSEKLQEKRPVQRRTSTRRLDEIRKRRIKNRRMILSMAAVALLFCIVLGVQMFQKYSTLMELRTQEKKLEEQYQAELELTQELKDKEAYVKTDEYVEEMARRLGLLYLSKNSRI